MSPRLEVTGVPQRTTVRAVGPVVAAAAALYIAFALARLAAFGWDPSAFVVAGDGITDVAHAPEHLGVNAGTDGYDGQAYYRLARSPLTDEGDDHGIAFTRPAYWQTRIGYPATAWVVSLGGQEALVPAALLLVNLAAVAAVACLAALLARSHDRSPWWALVPALWAGYLVGVAEDLTEPLAGALLLAALLALRRERWGAATTALTAAALTRETSLVLALALVGVALVPWLRRLAGGTADRTPAPWWTGAVPIVLYGAWRTWVRQRWPDPAPDAPGDNPLGAPFVELGRYLAHAAGDLAAEADNLVLLAPTLVAVALVAAGLATRDGGLPHERLALAAYLVVLACLPVWDRSQAYLRWCCEPVTLGWIVLLGQPAAHGRRALVGAVAALWLLTAVATYDYPDPDRWIS